MDHLINLPLSHLMFVTFCTVLEFQYSYSWLIRMYFNVGLHEELDSFSAVAVHPETTCYIVQHEPLVSQHASLPCHCHLHSLFAQLPWWCVNKWFNIIKFKDSEMNFEWIFEKVIEFDDDKITKYSFFIFTVQLNCQWIMWMYNSHYNI